MRLDRGDRGDRTGGYAAGSRCCCHGGGLADETDSALFGFLREREREWEGDGSDF